MIYELDGIAPEIPEDAWVAPDANLIGKVVLEAGANVWFGATLRGDNEEIRVGRGSNIQENTVCHTDMGYPLVIGADCTIGHKAMLHGCSIGEGTLIGINSVILNGAKIGKGSLIGANTLIAEGKEIPEGVLVVGSPGKVVRELKPEERERILKIADGYVERSKLFRTALKPQPLPDSAK